MSYNGLILAILAIATTFDWSWLISSAPPAGLNPMAFILGTAAVLVWHTDVITKNK